jgi:twin arginine-targeting protein translocase TatB
MFDISFSELFVILLVALVVLGPEKLNGLIRGLGRWIGQAKVYARNITAELERETSALEIKKQLQDARKVLQDETSAVEAAARSFEDDMRRGQNQAQNFVQELSKSGSLEDAAEKSADSTEALEAPEKVGASQEPAAAEHDTPPLKNREDAGAPADPKPSPPTSSEREQRGAA